MTEKEREALIEENQRLAWSVVHWARAREYSYTSDELYSLAIYAMYKAARVYRPELGAFSSLAVTAMKNEVLRTVQRDSRQKRRPMEPTASLDQQIEGLHDDGHTVALVELIASPDMGPEDALLLHERNRVIWAALDQLKDAERDAVISYYMRRETLNAIAKRQHCTRQNVQQKAARALDKLRSMLGSLPAEELTL